MVAKRKINEDLGSKIEEMAIDGMNAQAIARQIGVARDTIKKYCDENSITLIKRKNKDQALKEAEVVKFFSECQNLKQVKKKFKMGYETVVKLAINNGFEHLVRTHKKAAQDKVLTLDEITSRLPDKSTYLRFETGYYYFSCEKTGKEFKKRAPKIYQGSPFGKSGYHNTERDYEERLKGINYTIKKGTFLGMKCPVTVYCSKGHERNLSKASLVFRCNCPDCGKKAVDI